MAGKSEWRKLWDALQQLEGDPLEILGDVEAVAKSLLLSSVKEDNRQDKCVVSFQNQVYGNQTVMIYHCGYVALTTPSLVSFMLGHHSCPDPFLKTRFFQKGSGHTNRGRSLGAGDHSSHTLVS